MKRYVKGINRLELDILCCEICDAKNRTAIINCLGRNKIHSTRDLAKYDLCDISKFRYVGEMRLEFIKELKNIAEDEEKIQSIVEKDKDYMRMLNEDELYKEICRMDDAGYSVSRIARETGLRTSTVYRFV